MTAFRDRLPPALRGLLRHKGFSALAVVALGVAIALNTTMYSVMDAIVFPRVDMREPENLYRMPFYGDYRQRVSPEVKLEAIKAFTFFEDMALKLFNYGASNLAERGTQARPVRVLNISTNYFDLIGVRPLAGRLLGVADENSPTIPVVVSEAFWNAMFPERVGFDTATFTLDTVPRLVVGVLAKESDFPGENTDVWQLYSVQASARRLPTTFVFNILRLKPDLSVDDAFVELNATARKLAIMAGDPPADARFDLVKAVREPLRIQNFHFAIIGAVVFVMLVACFNLANLQLARGLSRTRELATRAAVGATRGDIIWLLVSEAAWLAVAGLVLGVILTFWGMYIVKASVPPSLDQYFIRPQISWRLFVFAATSGAFALSIVGLLPAIQVSRVDVNELIKSGSGTGTTRKSRWQAGSLVVAQVGLALALMVGATMLIRSSLRLYDLEVNPALERIVSVAVGVRSTGPDDRRTLQGISNALLTRARATQTVVEAATIRGVMPKHAVISVTDKARLAREIPTGSYTYQIVSDAIVRTYGFTIVRGRDFHPGETDASVILDEQTARYLWPAENPIGQQIKFGSDTRHDDGWLTVVGVVRYTNLWSAFGRANQEDRTIARLGAAFVLNSGDTARVGRDASYQVLVRGSVQLEKLPLAMRRALSDPSAGTAVFYSDQLRSALQLNTLRKRQNFVSTLFTSFALLALALSALGVYAVVSHTVSQRTREIGVRVALGASERDIRRSVFHQGNVMALSGAVVGLLIATQASRYLDRFMTIDDRWDNKLYALATVVLIVTTLLATWVPARRAMRINPVEALRSE